MADDVNNVLLRNENTYRVTYGGKTLWPGVQYRVQLTDAEVSAIPSGVWYAVLSTEDDPAPAQNMADLDDTLIASATTGDILVYNGTNWVNSSSSAGSGVSYGTLAGLSDVTITSVADGEFIVYSSASTAYVNDVPSVGSLSDVDLSTPATDAQILSYSSASSAFVPTSDFYGNAHATTLYLSSASAPSTSADAGDQGQVIITSAAIYYCYAPSSWVSGAMAAW